MILKTNLVGWEEIQHWWLLLSPENLEYTLSILWVLSLVESYQDSSLSPMWVMVKSHMCLGWVPCDWILYFVSPMCITKLLEWYTCGHIYLILDMWVPNGPQFVNCGHGWLLCLGTPSELGPFRIYSSPFAIPAQWHTAWKYKFLIFFWINMQNSWTLFLFLNIWLPRWRHC